MVIQAVLEGDSNAQFLLSENNAYATTPPIYLPSRYDCDGSSALTWVSAVSQLLELECFQMLQLSLLEAPHTRELSVQLHTSVTSAPLEFQWNLAVK